MNSVNHILEYLHGYKVTYLLMCAARWKLFDELVEPSTAVQVAERLKLNAENTEMALDIFSGLGVILKENNLYRIEKCYQELLTSTSERSMLPLFQLEQHLLVHHNTIQAMRDAWQYGKAGDTLNENGKEGIQKTYGQAMDNGGRLAALHTARIFSHLNEGLILDLGGGMGTYAEAICRLNSSLRMEVYDRPEMEKVCMDHLEYSGVKDRVTFKNKNILTDPIDSPCEGILLSNVLHLFTQEDNKKLLKRCAQALKPGGRLVVHDFFLDEQHTGNIPSLLFSIDWLLIGSGFHMSPRDLELCVEDSGLEVLAVKQFDSLPTSIIVLGKKNK
ncbi:MAG TPA: methyltransferase [Ruminiclostridium sp.]|nr:methyltransferase [Ruminiclostridium sp.]